MKSLPFAFGAVAVAAVLLFAVGCSKAPAVPNDDQALFNGRDLTGWHYEGEPALDGQTASSDGRFSAENGTLVVHPKEGEREIKKLWTTQEFEGNFILRLEFRAAVNADSGIYIRGPQLQCRDYLVAGPYNELKQYKPQDWNQIEAVVKDGVAYCTCNGEVLEEAMEIPAVGPIGLEADRGQMEYRNITVEPLP